MSKPFISDYTPEIIASTEQMIAESNAKRALGGLAYGEAVREEHRADVSGTFLGSMPSDFVVEDFDVEVLGERIDETFSDEEPGIPVNRHPAKTFEMPGLNRGRQNPDSQPVSRAEKRKAWSGMSDEEIEAQNRLNETRAEDVKRQIAQSKKDRQNNDNQDI